MADRPFDSNSELDVRPGRGSPPGMPRWVKVFGLIAIIVLIVFFVFLHFTGGGGMGHHH
jgi:hypothetical protein